VGVVSDVFVVVVPVEGYGADAILLAGVVLVVGGEVVGVHPSDCSASSTFPFRLC